MTTTQFKFSQIKNAYINVQDYGAVGDGNTSTGAGTNNDTAIAAALVASYADVNAVVPVYFPPGIYNHTGITIPLITGMELFGDKGGTVLNNTHASNNSITLTDEVANFRMKNMRLASSGGTTGAAVFGDTPPQTPFRDHEYAGLSIDGHLLGFQVSGMQNWLIRGPGQWTGQGIGTAGGTGFEIGDANLVTVQDNIYIASYERGLHNINGGPLVLNNCIIGSGVYLLDNEHGTVFSNGCYWEGLNVLETAGAFVAGQEYVIETPGSTNWALIGGAPGTAGTRFIATGAGAGTGTARTCHNVAIYGHGGYFYGEVNRTSWISQPNMVSDASHRTWAAGERTMVIAVQTALAAATLPAAQTDLTFTTVEENANGSASFDKTTGICTIGVSGWYRFTAMLDITATAAGQTMQVGIWRKPFGGAYALLSNGDRAAQSGLNSYYFGVTLDRKAWFDANDQVVIKGEASAPLAIRHCSLQIESYGA